jgi:hypothetical protein
MGTDPPFTITEVKFTWVPAHTLLAEGVITRLTGNSGLTVMVTTFEFAGLPVAQVALEVSVHETLLLLEGTKV